MNTNYKNSNKDLQTIFLEIITHLHQAGSLRLAILFGSRATGTATKRSDIDILAIYKHLSSPTILSPPDNLPLGVDILAIPENAFGEGLIKGTGLFIEAMTRGKILFGDPSTVQKYQDQTKQTIHQLRMIRTEIGWKRNPR